MHSYAEKAVSYFGHARKDIEPLLPSTVGHVLEVGCSSGATLAWLKAQKRSESTTGIELFASAAEKARTQVDTVLCGPAEEMLRELPEGRQYDLVLCLDVLEHMVDPWVFLRELVQRMRPGGQMIVSLPNIRFIGVLAPLLLQGQWRYREEGVLDRTHLRFFTRRTALELVQGAGLDLLRWRGNAPPARTTVGNLDAVTFGLLKEFTAYQWLIAARRGMDTPN
jgi:2-polyprenyl-3-methyl-5-hydroxy-6-metoxy-1,4-benzoquinol methylase